MSVEMLDSPRKAEDKRKLVTKIKSNQSLKSNDSKNSVKLSRKLSFNQSEPEIIPDSQPKITRTGS